MIDTKKIIVTGSNGFIGKHVSLALSSMGYKVYGYDIDNNLEDLKREIVDSSFLIHLAGINRPTSPSLFYQGHVDLTNAIVQVAIKYNPQIKIISNSSIQATLDNDYGRSKRTMEEMLLHSPLLVHIIRFYNVFGKWCRPNYNSVVATYCHNIAHDLPIYIDEPNRIMELNYIDDVVKEIINIIQNDKLFKKGIFYCAKV